MHQTNTVTSKDTGSKRLIQVHVALATRPEVVVEVRSVTSRPEVEQKARATIRFVAPNQKVIAVSVREMSTTQWKDQVARKCSEMIQIWLEL